EPPATCAFRLPRRRAAAAKQVERGSELRVLRRADYLRIDRALAFGADVTAARTRFRCFWGQSAGGLQGAEQVAFVGDQRVGDLRLLRQGHQLIGGDALALDRASG